MVATRLTLALLVGSLLLGMCLSKPAQKEKRMQRRHEVRQYYTNCTEGDYVCSSGQCIPSHWECDFYSDCPDGGDELGCEIANCAEGEYSCSSGQCIPSHWECDTDLDCPDGGDELGCEFADCAEDQFTCFPGRCIPSSWLCDNESDCPDGVDEDSCSNGLGFGKKKSANKLPNALQSVAKKHMKTEKSLTDDQKEILDIINEKQSEMKKSRLAAKKALVL